MLFWGHMLLLDPVRCRVGGKVPEDTCGCFINQPVNGGDLATCCWSSPQFVCCVLIVDSKNPVFGPVLDPVLDSVDAGEATPDISPKVRRSALEVWARLTLQRVPVLFPFGSSKVYDGGTSY
ncbi:hypothetical protein ILYODFUR_011394 [Ilyodon furcidens]|uniref:Uncharacterized protein n=1 Tax=Ilyodon furcidens TaxID=33524 RepID=A0ABV0TTR9_9TELE